MKAALDEFVTTVRGGIAKGEKALEMAVGVDDLTDLATAAKAKVEAAASEGAEAVKAKVEEVQAKLKASRDEMEARIKKSAATVNALDFDDPAAIQIRRHRHHG